VDVTGVPDGLEFSSDGSRLFVSDVFGGTVSVVEIDSGEVRSTARVGESTGAMLLIP
jgi:DNA-binding beta-propeller fold protein YncE